MNLRSLNALRRSGAPAKPRWGELPADHPMVRASEAVRYTTRQWVHVAAVLTGGLIARLENYGWALALIASAAITLVVLTLRLEAFRQREHDRAIDLILDGHDRISLAVVQRQRQRLASERTRQSLARSLEDTLHEAAKPLPLRARLSAVPVDPTVVAAAAGEIVEVVCLLRLPGASTRGVARAERLVEHALSPLYGRDADALREELRGVRHLLEN